MKLYIGSFGCKKEDRSGDKFIADNRRTSNGLKLKSHATLNDIFTNPYTYYEGIQLIIKGSPTSGTKDRPLFHKILIPWKNVSKTELANNFESEINHIPQIKTIFIKYMHLFDPIQVKSNNFKYANFLKILENLREKFKKIVKKEGDSLILIENDLYFQKHHTSFQKREYSLSLKENPFPDFLAIHFDMKRADDSIKN